MRRIQFAVTVVAAGLWGLGSSAVAQDDRPSRENRRQDTRTSQDQANPPQSTSGTLSKSDRDFLIKAAEAGMAEVQIGKLAEEKGASEAVKELGQKLVEDHTKANEELQALAQSKGVTLPAELDSRHKSEIDKLSRLSGGEFDRELERHVAKDHKKDLSEFRREADNGSDPDLKSYASKWLPGLEEHEKLAEQAMSNTNKTNPRTDEDTTGGKKKRQPDYK